MKNTEEDFWAQVEKTETCWIWKGKFCVNRKTNFKHSAFRIARRTAAPHRWAWFFKFGVWPRMMRLTCATPECIRPEHYRLGRKISPEQEEEIGRLLASGVKQCDVAERYGVMQSAISYVLKCLRRRAA